MVLALGCIAIKARANRAAKVDRAEAGRRAKGWPVKDSDFVGGKKDKMVQSVAFALATAIFPAICIALYLLGYIK